MYELSTRTANLEIIYDPIDRWKRWFRHTISISFTELKFLELLSKTYQISIF